MTMGIEGIEARLQDGFYPNGAPMRYTVTVRVSVKGADDAAEAAALVAAAINDAEEEALRG